MADPLPQPPLPGPLLKGSYFPVHIEDVIADVLVVCLEHGASIYKGILLDSTKRDLPYGIGFDRFKLDQEKRENVAEQTTIVDPNIAGSQSSIKGGGTDKPVELSALSARYSYQDPNNSEHKLLSPPRRNLVKPIRDSKNIRNMRLRPRKVLCSNCSQGIHDTQVKGNTTSVSTKNPVNSQNQNIRTIVSTRPPLRMSFLSRPTLRMSLRGKRKNEEVVAASPPAAKRPRKQPIHTKTNFQPFVKIPKLPNNKLPNSKVPIARVVANRINPVIKISFTSPQGEVHTSKLHTSRTTTADDIVETEPEESPRPEQKEENAYDDYKRLKRALKKAKLKDRSYDNDSSAGSEVTTTVPDENLIRHHKKSKRNKHKRKHRHRSAIQSPVHDPNDQDENNSDFENDAAKAGIQDPSRDDQAGEKRAKEVEDWDTGYHHVYHETSPYPKENSHFKENSINVPLRQQPTPTRPFHSPHDIPSCMEGDTQTFTPKSPYANHSSCANSQIGSVSPSSNFETDDEGDMPPAGDEFPDNGPEQLEEARLRPLMMKIQTKTVSTGFLPDGRHVRVGDVVWGKIHGFPWWPGKILSITVSQRDNGTVITQMAHIAWCGSSTMSHMPCSELYPFLEDFKYRYNKKKKGTYKNAIKEATRIAQSLITSLTAITTSDSTAATSDRDEGIVVDSSGI